MHNKYQVVLIKSPNNRGKNDDKALKPSTPDNPFRTAPMFEPEKAKNAVPAAISTVEMREKLKNLSEHLFGATETTYAFAKILADRIGSEDIVPLGFVMAADLLLQDLMVGIDGVTGKPMSDLTGYPPMIYVQIRMFVPKIAEATCPADFAAEVKQIIGAA